MTTKTLPALAAAARGARRPKLAALLGQWALSSNAALVFGFLYLPILILIVFSFNDTRSVAVFTGFSTQWYDKLIHNDELLQAAQNSLIVGLIATAASTVIGTLTALGVHRHRFALRTTLDANLYLPIVIPEIVMGISLLLFFNQALFPLIQTLTGYALTTGLPTITAAHIAFDIPFVYVIVRARLADFDHTLEEAAQDLGADEWRTFRRITLPLLMPGVIGGALMAFTLSLDDYLITAFTKGVGSQTMPLYIYSLVRRGVTPEINALSTTLLIGSIGLVGLSLTAQSGGPTFTRAMGLGAAAGVTAHSLARLAGNAAGGAFSFSSLAWLLPLLLPVWAARWIGEWREDLLEANTSARLLATLTLILTAAAVYISMALLFA